MIIKNSHSDKKKLKRVSTFIIIIINFYLEKNKIIEIIKNSKRGTILLLL